MIKSKLGILSVVKYGAIFSLISLFFPFSYKNLDLTNETVKFIWLFGLAFIGNYGEPHFYYIFTIEGLITAIGSFFLISVSAIVAIKGTKKVKKGSKHIDDLAKKWLISGVLPIIVISVWYFLMIFLPGANFGASSSFWDIFSIGFGFYGVLIGAITMVLGAILDFVLSETIKSEEQISNFSIEEEKTKAVNLEGYYRYLWIFPLIGGILALIGFLVPVAYLYSFGFGTYIWKFGFVYYYGYGRAEAAIIINISSSVFIGLLIIIITSSTLTIIGIIGLFYFAKKYKFEQVNLGNQGLIFGIVLVISDVFFIIGMAIPGFAYPINFWTIFLVGAGPILGIIGGSFGILGGIFDLLIENKSDNSYSASVSLTSEVESSSYDSIESASYTSSWATSSSNASFSSENLENDGNYLEADQTWQERGLELYEDENYDLAKTCFKKDLKLNPQGIISLTHLGAIYIRNQKWKKSLKYYKKAAILDSNDNDILFSIMSIYFEKKKHQKTIEYAKKILKIDPNNRQAIDCLNVSKKKLEEERQNNSQEQINYQEQQYERHRFSLNQIPMNNSRNPQSSTESNFQLDDENENTYSSEPSIIIEDIDTENNQNKEESIMCRACGSFQSMKARFCSYCSSPLKKECPQCKSLQDLHALICSNCRYDFDS